MNRVKKYNMAEKVNSVDENEIYEQKFQRTLCTFLDENFPEDLRNVRQCLELMEKKRNSLEKQVGFKNGLFILQV